MKKYTRILTILLAACLLLSGCGNQVAGGSSDQQTASQTSKPADEQGESTSVSTKKTPADTLVIGTMEEPMTLYQPECGNAYMIMRSIYEPLALYSGETEKVEPRVAESWEYEDDTTLVFTIRDGIKFADGSACTAEDALFSLQKCMEDTTKTKSVLSFVDIDNCKVDGNKLVVKMKAPTASALILLGNVGIFSKAFYERNNGSTGMNVATMGTGPYTATKLQTGYNLVCTRNENYWGEAPYFKTVEFRFYSESTTLMVDIETGALDMATQLAENDVARIQNGETSGIKLDLISSYELYTMRLWPKDPKFADERVRQAVAHAIDTESIAEVCVGALGAPAYSNIAESIQFHIDCDTYEYDPEKAKSLLADAGVNGLELTMVIETDNVIKSMAEVIQAQLAEVGITLTVESYDTTTAIPKWLGIENNGEPECDVMIIKRAMNAPDPDNTYTPFLKEDAFAILTAPEELQEKIYKARSLMDDAQRQKLHEEIQRDFITGAYCIPLSEYKIAVAYQDYIKGYAAKEPTCTDCVNVYIDQ